MQRAVALKPKNLGNLGPEAQAVTMALVAIAKKLRGFAYL